MSLYRFELDWLKLVVTRDDEPLWNGTLKPNLHTYGYSATDAGNTHYELKPSGFFWWKKQRIYADSTLIDEFKLFKSMRTGVRLNRRQFIVNGEGEYLFSVQNDRTQTVNGIALFNWECDVDLYLPQIVSFLVMRHQGRGVAYGIYT